MPNIVRINVDGTMNDVKISITTIKTIIKQLNNITLSKGSTDLKQLYRWNYLDKEIYCYGWYDGEHGFENKHDLLPNGNSSFLCDEDSSEKLLFGDIFILWIDTNSKKPYFVLKISKSDNTVYVGPHEYLFQTNFNAININIQSNKLNSTNFDAYVKIRYKAKLFKAKIKLHADSTADIEFEAPQRAITPGQAVVFYSTESNGDEVIGGGIIDSVNANFNAIKI